MNYATTYGIYWLNFDMTDQNTFDTRSQAANYAKTQCMEYSIITIQKLK